MDHNNFVIGASNKQRIILDETALLPRSFQDAHMNRRDAQAEHILTAINRLSEGLPTDNLFIYGPSGSGKTALVRKAIGKTEENRRILCIYANCWHYNTSMSLYTKIADSLGEVVSRRGRASDEIFDRIVELVRASNRPVLLVLDEIDALIRYDNARILNNIASIDDERFPFGIIAISDYENLLSKLPPITRDTLRFTKIEIPPYNREELAAVLNKRAIAGLRPGAYSDSIIREIADMCAVANGNGRLAIEVLWRAARSSEDHGLDSISNDELERIKESLELTGNGLSGEERAIVDLLESGPMSSSRLYALFYRRMPKTKRQIRNYLHFMEEKGIIKTQYVQGKYNYGSTIIQLCEGWSDG